MGRVPFDCTASLGNDRVRLKQVDWPHAIRDAANFISQRVTDEVELAGGGTLDPPIGMIEDPTPASDDDDDD
jgi:hypothetical protein